MSKKSANLNDADEIGRLVQGFLNSHQPPEFRLDVVQDGIQRDDGWWYVPVVPTPENVRSHEYANALAGIEEEIQDRKSLNVLLVPTVVDD